MKQTETFAFSEIIKILGAQTKRMAYVALHQLGYTYEQIAYAARVLEWTPRDAITSKARSKAPVVNIIGLGARKIRLIAYLMGGNIRGYLDAIKPQVDVGGLICSHCGKHVDQIFPGDICWTCHRASGNLVEVHRVSKSARGVKIPMAWRREQAKIPARRYY